MGKGFGRKPEEQLGYLLRLMPEFKAYAAKLSLSHYSKDEEFIGIVSRIEDAQIWKSIKEAKQAIGKYTDFLLDEAEKSSQREVCIEVRRLKRSADGNLIDELVESLFLASRDS
jgi:hypothetical protein